jgi:hypothetical protein
VNEVAVLPTADPGEDAKPAVATRPILFVHIPKTAGTSFLGALCNALGDAHVLRFSGADATMHAELGEVVRGMHPQIACVVGHVPMHLVASVCGGEVGRSFRPFTLLRHPVARVFSLFRFLRRANAVEMQRMGLAPDFSFADFIKAPAPELFGQINNGMTRMLCGLPAFWQPTRQEFWHLDTHWAAAQAAMKAVSAMDFGLVEEMQLTQRLLCRRWGLASSLDVGVENSTDTLGVEADIGAIAEIVARNQLDLALYECAAALFRARAGASNEVNTGGQMFAPALDREVVITDIPGRQGFHSADDAGFCWLRAEQPARIHLRAPVPRASLILQCYALTPDYPISRIGLLLNGQPITSRMTWREPHWFEIETEPLAFDQQLCTLSIDPPVFISVRQVAPDTLDLRYLSIAVRSLTLCSA